MFCPKARLLGVQRAEKLTQGGESFLRIHAANLMAERLADVTFDFSDILMEAHPSVAELPTWHGKRVQRSHILLGECQEKLESYDLLYSLLELHWRDDLQESLLRYYFSLRAGGLLQGCLIGGDSLSYLRDCLMRAETELDGGVSPRVIPFVDMESLVGMLGSIGFSGIVVDKEILHVRYGDLYGLMRDLRLLGEGNYLSERRKNFTARRLFERANEIYTTEYSDGEGGEGIIARFELLFMHGWKM